MNCISDMRHANMIPIITIEANLIFYVSISTSFFMVLFNDIIRIITKNRYLFKGT